MTTLPFDAATATRLAGLHCRDYAELVSHAAPAHLSILRSGQIVRANLSAARLLNADLATLTGKKLEQFLAPEAHECVRRMVDAVLDPVRDAVRDPAVNADAAATAALDGAAPAAHAVLTQDLASLHVRITATADATDGVCNLIVVDMDFAGAREAALQRALLITGQMPEGVLVCDRDHRALLVNPAFTTITGYSLEELTGRTPFFLGPRSPLARPPGAGMPAARMPAARMQAFALFRQMLRTLRGGGEWRGEVPIECKNGAPLLASLSIKTLMAAGGAAQGVICLFDDKSEDTGNGASEGTSNGTSNGTSEGATDVKLLEVVLQDAPRNFDAQVVERLSSLMEVNGTLNQEVAERQRAERDLRVVERFFHATIDSLTDHVLVLDEAGTVVHANKAWCDFSGQASDGFSYLALCEADRRWMGNSGVEFAAGIRSVIWGMPLSFALEYEYEHEHEHEHEHRSEHDHQSGPGPERRHALRPRDQSERTQRARDARERRWFHGKVSRFVADGPPQVIVTHTDITKRKVMERVLQQSQHQLRKLAEHMETVKEHERQRIARDIHDELGQNLLALRIDISMLGERTAHSHPHLHQRVNIVLGNIDATIKSVRGIMNDLRPLVLDLGLQAALEWQIRELRKRSSIKCQLLVPDEAVFALIDSKVDIVLFRIVQEALSNILRHANATWTEISLREQAGQLLLLIRDDGIGIQGEQSREQGREQGREHSQDSGGFGLIGIAERIAALGGDFDFGSPEVGQGCELIVRIPLFDHRDDAGE